MKDAVERLPRDADVPGGQRAAAAAAAAERDGAAAEERDGAAVDKCDGATADDDADAPSSASPTPDDLIKLNVGGVRFETSRAVLTSVEDSMLGRMFGRCDAMLQQDPEDGSISIGRDGEMFGMILDFLRDVDGPRMLRAIRALPEVAQEALVQELDYFGLVTAVFGVRPWTDGATFRAGPGMSEGRSCCAATFAGGRVLVLGGLSRRYSLRSLRSTEVLDAETAAFTAGPNLLEGRHGCAAVQIDAERVLVAGGYGGGFLRTTEILHHYTLTVTPGPDLLSARAGLAAVALDAGRILFVGGVGGGSQSTGGTEILTLETMAFAPGPAVITARWGCAAVALDEHRIMVVGGASASAQVLNSTEILDIRTMAFKPGPAMRSGRYVCAAVPVDAQHVIVIGGWDSSGVPTATTEVLDVETLEFAPGPTMQTGRQGCAATRLDAAGEEPRILVVGGNADRYKLTTEVLAPEDPRTTLARL